VSGPGELTLTSIVLFTLGAYGIASGAASGEQGVVAIGVFAFALFVVGIVWPIVMLSGVTVEVWAPADVMVGERHDVHLRLHGRVARVELRLLDPPGQWWMTASPANGLVPRVAARRGVVSRLRVELRTSAPLGVFVRTRVVTVALPHEQSVAPHPDGSPVPAEAAPRYQERPNDAVRLAAPTAVRGVADSVRAVRPYVPGDSARLVHWPTSARRGTLVVREYEPTMVVGVALVVELSGAADAVEHAASRAAGIGVATLNAGGVVWCCTCEGGRPLSAPVTDARDLGRRLARAGAGAPGTPPAGWPVVTVSA